MFAANQRTFEQKWLQTSCVKNCFLFKRTTRPRARAPERSKKTAKHSPSRNRTCEWRKENPERWMAIVNIWKGKEGTPVHWNALPLLKKLFRSKMCFQPWARIFRFVKLRPCSKDRCLKKKPAIFQTCSRICYQHSVLSNYIYVLTVFSGPGVLIHAEKHVLVHVCAY